MGTPKALLYDDQGRSFLEQALVALREGGCDNVLVVLGAGAAGATAILGDGVPVVVAEDWAEGMGASLRTGLAAAAGTDASCVLVTLVDLPDVGAPVVERVLRETGTGEQGLARASYAGVPGHPVLLGRAHWDGVAASARGDRGARDYLREHPPLVVECGDLATGRDVDTPEQLR
jgi:CTP:molybdopterin cytidylyltransferase MocA